MNSKIKTFAVGLSFGLLVAIFAFVQGESRLLDAEENKTDGLVIVCDVNTKELCIVDSGT
jgi:hypothetical protein